VGIIFSLGLFSTFATDWIAVHCELQVLGLADSGPAYISNDNAVWVCKESAWVIASFFHYISSLSSLASQQSVLPGRAQQPFGADPPEHGRNGPGRPWYKTCVEW